MIFIEYIKNKLSKRFNKLNNGSRLTVELKDTDVWYSLFPQYSDDVKEYYRSIAYACINTRAEKVIGAEVNLYKHLPGRDIEEITDHPFINLINNSNNSHYSRGSSFREINYWLSVSLDLYGNAYVYYPRNKFRMPQALYFLPSKFVTAEYNADFTAIKNYVYRAGNRQITYSPDEIIHFRLPDPDNLFRGKATASACRFALDIDYYQSVYQKNFYLNDASIGMIFETERNLDSESYKRLKEQIREKYTGPKKAGSHIILEGGLKSSRSQATAKEQDYVESRKAVRDEICGIFRVPKSILGFTDDVNRANAEASVRTFLRNTIIPFSFFIQDKWDRFVKINYDERLMVRFDYDLSEERDLQLKAYEIFLQNGVLTPDEVREREGWNKKVKS
jgi:HK97 family phage portal protein